jgi:nicotinate-nucleotide adenylyltransferase
MREQHNDASLGLIVGMDAFLGLTSWHRWDELLDFAHIVVAHRPGWRAPDIGVLGELLTAHGTHRVDDLHENRQGRIHIHAVTQLEIASTEIRELVAVGRDPRFLTPDAVRDVILESGCYA